MDYDIININSTHAEIATAIKRKLPDNPRIYSFRYVNYYSNLPTARSQPLEVYIVRNTTEYSYGDDPFLKRYIPAGIYYSTGIEWKLLYILEYDTGTGLGFTPENVINKVTVIDGTANNTTYPSTLAVANYVSNVEDDSIAYAIAL